MRACDLSVYKFTYNTTFSERVSTCGGMDSELTGRKLTEERTYLCVAPDEILARAIYNKWHKQDEFVKLKTVGQLNDLVYLQ